MASARQGGYTEYDSASILSDNSDNVFEEAEEEWEEEEEEGEEKMGVAYHTIIIDCAPIGFADSMGVAMIEQVCTMYMFQHVTMTCCL